MADDQWWHDPNTLRARVEECGGFAQAARVYGGKASTLKSAWTERHKMAPFVDRSEKHGVSILDGEATVTGKVGESDVDAMVARAGLSLDDWLVERAVLNEWEAMSKDEAGDPIVTKLHQLKVFLKKRVDLGWLFPATEVEERWVPTGPTDHPAQWLEMIAGDQQAPYFDADLHAVVLRWMHDVQPNGLSLVGDTLDLPTISRHPDNPTWAAKPQECIQAAYGLLSDYRDAAPNARMRKLLGNHDHRLESELLTRAERMWNIRPAQIPGGGKEPRSMSVRRLLHLDALGIELVGDEGAHWKMAQIELAPDLIVRHEIPKPGGRRMQASMIGGHTHRQDITYSTEWVGADPVTYALMQVGCLAMSRGGLGYAKDPNWQPGFGTASIDTVDGTYGFDLATWRNGKLTWRGQTWT